MRFRLLTFLCGGLLAVAACNSNDIAAPRLAEFNNSDAIDLVPDFAISGAAVVDGGGIGAAHLPDSLKLTAEQKAAIQALHESFMVANKADLEALKAIEAEAKAAKKAGKSREEVRAILERSRPILDRLHAAFARLQEAIWAIYTPAQRAWIDAHRPKVCGPDGPPKLSETQIAQIRTLREAFHTAMKVDLELIKAVHQEARDARKAGKSEAEVKTILAKATAAMERVRAAEKKLHEDIMNLLTPEQRAKWCVVRPHHGKRP